MKVAMLSDFGLPVGVKDVIYELQGYFAAEACSTTEDGDEPLHCPTGYECHIINPGNMAEGIPNRGQCIKLRGNPGQFWKCPFLSVSVMQTPARDNGLSLPRKPRKPMTADVPPDLLQSQRVHCIVRHVCPYWSTDDLGIETSVTVKARGNTKTDL